MSKIWQQLLAIWTRLEVAQRATIVLALAGGLVAIGFLSWGATRPDYTLLAADLPRAKVAQISAWLESNSIPYRVVDNETAILVPAAKRNKALNELAQNGSLGEAGKGFELLDKGGFMESTFREHRTYDRAVGGELERIFRELPGVKGARVLIDRPQPSPFIADEEGKPRAAVKLEMLGGRRLSERQVSGVIRMVVGAIAGMEPNHVQVMDGNGLLTTDDADPGSAQAHKSLEAEAAREVYLTRKGQEMLDRVLGPGRAAVKVNVKLDFTRRTEQVVDPTKLKEVQTEHTTTTDKKTPVVAGGGVAGTASNVEGEGRPTAAAPVMGSETKEETQSTYVVGKKTVTQEDEVGRIRGMTVSILLPFQTVVEEEKDKEGKPTGKKTTRTTAYSDEDKKRFESLVLEAIGFNSSRDLAGKAGATAFTSTVQSMDLWREPDAAVAQAAVMPLVPVALQDWAGYGVAGLVAIVVLLVARGQLKRSHQAWAEAEARARKRAEEEEARHRPAEPPPEERDEEDESAKLLRSRRLELKEVVKKRILEDPNMAAQVIKKWLYEG